MKKYLILFISLVFLKGNLSSQENKASVQLAAAIYEEEVTGKLDKAVELYQEILKKYPDDRPVAAKTLYHLGLVNEKMGKQKAGIANEYFTRLVNAYPDQIEMVSLAKARLAALGGSGVTGSSGGLIARRILPDASGIGGALSSDGKYISHIDGGTGDVIQFEVTSGKKIRIKNKGLWSENEKKGIFPAFSHDGKRLVYSVESFDPDTKDRTTQLRIRNMDGSNLRTLYSEKGVVNAIPVDWSPDAGSILTLCSRDKNKSELTLISTADGSARVLRNITSPLFWMQRADFSPDGRFIALSFVGDGNPPHGDVHLMTVDGRNEIIVAGHPAEDKLFGWTPDGKNLVFLSDRSGTWDIWAVRITGGTQQGEPELLKKDFAWDSMVLGFTPDGCLYYMIQSDSGHLYNGEVDPETCNILVPPEPVNTTGRPSQPTWSSEGSYLAYISRRGSVTNGIANDLLTIRSTATGEERFLSPRLRYINQISWAPDGRSVIALGIEETETGIFRIDTETNEITRLADQGLFPKLCPDGKTLVFVGELIIRKRNLETGEVSEVVKAGKMYYDLSPDGREVVFQVDGTIKIVSINGGEPRKLFQGLAQNYRLEWTRDGSYIIVKALSSESLDNVNNEIWRIPVKGGTPLKIDLSVPKMETFALHPDNRRFAFATNEGTKQELWVMENFLPK